MKVTILLFARAKELAGSGQMEFEVAPGSTIGALRSQMGALHPDLAEVVRRSLFAIDEEYAKDDEAVPENAIIACIPPVSGG